MNKFDFSLHGLPESFYHTVKVVGYIVVSGALTALINYFQPLSSMVGIGLVYTGVNALLAFLAQWWTTKAPAEVVPISPPSSAIPTVGTTTPLVN